MTPEITLSADEFDLMWSALDLGPMPYPLDVPSVGRTMEQRAELTAQALSELAARGLATRDGLAERAAGLLRLLATPKAAIDVIGHHRGPVRALVAAAGRVGVLAELADEQLRLTEIRPTALAAAAVAVLPEEEPGQLRGLSMPTEMLHRALSEDEDFDDPFGADMGEDVALVKAGVPQSDAAILIELTENRRAGGQFGITDRGARSATVLSWFDTDQGRYLVVNANGWLSINPADNRRIEGRLAEAVSRVA